MELESVAQIERATRAGRTELFRLGTALLFVVAIIKERKRLQSVYRHELVKRSHLIRIATAWVITVPLSGLMAAFLYFTIRGMMLP